MRATTRAWIGRGVVAVLLAVAANAVLSVLAIEHDAALVALLAVSTVVVVLLTLAALDANTQTGWTITPRPGATRDRRGHPHRDVPPRGRRAPDLPRRRRHDRLADRRPRPATACASSTGCGTTSRRSRSPSCSDPSSPTGSRATGATATSPTPVTSATRCDSSERPSGGSRSCDQPTHRDRGGELRRRAAPRRVGGDRQVRRAAPGPGRHPRRWPRAAAGPPGPGQDAGRAVDGPGTRHRVHPRPVHPRPAARRPDRLLHLQPAHRRLRVPRGPAVHRAAAGRRDQPDAPQDAGRPPRGDAGTSGHRRGTHLRAAAALPRARHGQPGRVRRHLPAARGPARPVPALRRVRLPHGRGGVRRPAQPDRPPAGTWWCSTR